MKSLVEVLDASFDRFFGLIYKRTGSFSFNSVEFFFEVNRLWFSWNLYDLVLLKESHRCRDIFPLRVGFSTYIHKLVSAIELAFHTLIAFSEALQVPIQNRFMWFN